MELFGGTPDPCACGAMPTERIFPFFFLPFDCGRLSSSLNGLCGVRFRNKSAPGLLLGYGAADYALKLLWNSTCAFFPIR